MATTAETQALIDRKEKMRRAAYDARAAQQSKDEVSRAAIKRFVNLPEYATAKTIMWYIDCRSELRTRHDLPAALATDKQIIVPYCTVDEHGENKLGLWKLESFDELVIGKWKILEPPRDRWLEEGRCFQPEMLDLVMVPGVGFDRHGARMGNGQGYYDRLLSQVRADCPLVAMAYESQLFDEIAMGPHDIFMDYVVTEEATYRGRGR